MPNSLAWLQLQSNIVTALERCDGQRLGLRVEEEALDSKAQQVASVDNAAGAQKL